ncbi:carboxypeptidase-like regulatory domain-containing protein [Flavobacterium sp.]|uniref:carboxypeptidase-like regulatory domain-containing protein n=1 Tax=Flavobacterium sp. TaxID=239 RepID=UPI002CFBE6EF|nr:carboxypeptidase-like regulatory domain-containing protein [Flavobacterium sp.]HSD06001.1 carboxypeptidase-like regulatory domain-containing protein [Flavobacterium sp.]
MKHINSIFFLIVFSILYSCSEEKIDTTDVVYGKITGKVVTSDTFAPLQNVKVFSSPSSSIVFTDAEGNFVINNIKVGEYALQAQIDGYLTKFESVTVNKDQTSEVVFEMSVNSGPNVIPTIPTVVAPLDNAINQPINTKLEWNATDSNTKDVLTYEIKIRNDKNSDVLVFSDLKEKTLQLTNLTYGTKYFWQVSVTDSKSAAILSPLFSFSTLPFPTTRYLLVQKVNSNNVIYAVDDANKLYQITDPKNNSWRPRKNNQSGKIAFIQSSGAQNHIFMMNPDGTNVAQITSAVPIAGFNPDFIGFSWNAAGNKVIYPYFDKLYMIGSDGSGLTKIFQTPDGKFISECDWSSDGTKIALKVNDLDGYNAKIYVINTSGDITDQIISGQSGAIGSLNFSVTGQKLLYCRDVSGYENPTYRQLDMRIFEYNFATLTSYQILTEKNSGTNDYDARYSPNESEIIFTNSSNDGISAKNILKTTIGATNSRQVLFTGSMPDWE